MTNIIAITMAIIGVFSPIAEKSKAVEAARLIADERFAAMQEAAKTKTAEKAASNQAVIPAVRYYINDDERAEIERIVASEGGYCDYRFQALVAECILNDCEADNLRPLEIFERGDFRITRDLAPTETTKQAVSDVFDKGIMPCEEKIRYYYNPDYCQSPAHESKRYVLTDTGCRFFAD